MKRLSSIFYIFFIVFFFFACNGRPKHAKFYNYDQATKAIATLTTKELQQGTASDTLFFGIYFKMTSKLFYEHCNTMFKKGLFKGGFDYKVVVNFDNEFSRPVVFKFYPVFENDVITRMLCTFSYVNADVFKRVDRSDIIITEVVPFLWKWYGGNDFIAMPSKNPIKKSEYIKVDANRKITVTEGDNGTIVNVIFDDLKPL